MKFRGFRKPQTARRSDWLGVINVCFGSLADISERIGDVRFSPESGHAERQHLRPLSARSEQARVLQRPPLSLHREFLAMKSAVGAPDWSTIPVPIDDELRGTLSVLEWHRYRFPVPTADLLIFT